MFLEKHGGLWGFEEPTLFEQFDETHQRIGVVYERDGVFRAVVYEKLADPQWRLPVWGEVRPDSICESLDDAIGQVRSSLTACAPE